MRPTDVGDQTIIRLADLHELGDVIRMVGTHFDNCQLCVPIYS